MTDYLGYSDVSMITSSGAAYGKLSSSKLEDFRKKSGHGTSQASPSKYISEWKAVHESINIFSMGSSRSGAGVGKFHKSKREEMELFGVTASSLGALSLDFRKNLFDIVVDVSRLVCAVMRGEKDAHTALGLPEPVVVDPPDVTLEQMRRKWRTTKIADVFHHKTGKPMRGLRQVNLQARPWAIGSALVEDRTLWRISKPYFMSRGENRSIVQAETHTDTSGVAHTTLYPLQYFREISPKFGRKTRYTHGYIGDARVKRGVGGAASTLVDNKIKGLYRKQRSGGEGVTHTKDSGYTSIFDDIDVRVDTAKKRAEVVWTDPQSSRTYYTMLVPGTSKMRGRGDLLGAIHPYVHAYVKSAVNKAVSDISKNIKSRRK